MKAPRFIDKKIQKRFGKKHALRLFTDKTTRHGPFKGMEYPDFVSVGSALFPKLLGSYERELNPIIEEICSAGYSEVVDVGCAEGYYAVGLAMRIPEARVFAYDTSDKARAQCARMAELNGVKDRVEIRKFCAPEALCNLDLTRKALVVSDCEGYENILFTPEVVVSLARHDVLIETHDLFDITITSTLRKRFSKTHDLKVITSIDDVQKPHYYDYAELKGFDLKEKKILLGERRKAIMEWFFFTPKSSER